MIHLHYTFDEIERVVSAENLPDNPQAPSPRKAIRINEVDLARDCLALHKENQRLNDLL